MIYLLVPLYIFKFIGGGIHIFISQFLCICICIWCLMLVLGCITVHTSIFKNFANYWLLIGTSFSIPRSAVSPVELHFLFAVMQSIKLCIFQLRKVHVNFLCGFICSMRSCSHIAQQFIPPIVHSSYSYFLIMPIWMLLCLLSFALNPCICDKIVSWSSVNHMLKLCRTCNGFFIWGSLAWICRCGSFWCQSFVYHILAFLASYPCLIQSNDFPSVIFWILQKNITSIFHLTPVAVHVV